MTRNDWKQNKNKESMYKIDSSWCEVYYSDSCCVKQWGLRVNMYLCNTVHLGTEKQEPCFHDDLINDLSEPLIPFGIGLCKSKLAFFI